VFLVYNFARYTGINTVSTELNLAKLPNTHEKHMKMRYKSDIENMTCKPILVGKAKSNHFKKIAENESVA